MGPPQLSDRLAPLFSERTTEHFRHPRNVGRLAAPTSVGRASDAATENDVEVHLRVEAGRIVQTGFRTFGCSACVAASSAATELAMGRDVLEACAIDVTAILTELDGLPQDKLHCAELAARALAEALSNLPCP